MAELLVVRHGQASFGSDNYDRLSALGETQARALGQLLRDLDWVPDRLVTGTLERQRETLRHMGFDAGDTHAGWNEYDFHDLLRVRYDGTPPDPVLGDRKTHFRTLRETVFQWQDGGLQGARETWDHFTARVASAQADACRPGAERILVVSSGGVIGQMTATQMQAPKRMMMTLNLQVKNTAMTRLVGGGDRWFLHEFNATPHFSTPQGAELLSYS